MMIRNRILGLVTVTLSITSLAVALAQAPASKPAGAPAEAKPKETTKTVSPEETAIRNLVADISKAYNAANADQIAALFTENALLVDTTGEETVGRTAIAAQYKGGFSGGPTAKLTGTIETVRIPHPEVGTATGFFQFLDDKDAPVGGLGKYRLVAVKTGSGWKVAELHDEFVEEPAPDEENPLAELAWLVGDWIDEGEGVKIVTNVKWAENESFLVRTYSVTVNNEPSTSGTQWIGYDPRTGQIKSWVFDSAGGHGEGLWARFEDQWIVKSTGTMRDGRATSATQIWKPINKDSVKLQSLDRIVGGVVMPPIDEVIMVRKAPAPSAPATPAPAKAAPAGTTPAAKK